MSSLSPSYDMGSQGPKPLPLGTACPPWCIFSLFRFARANGVEPDPRGFDGVERVLLHLDGGRSLRRTRKRTAGDRPVVVALRALQLLERGRVLSLPFDPCRIPRH